MTTPNWQDPNPAPTVTVVVNESIRGNVWYDCHASNECVFAELHSRASVERWLAERGLGDYAAHIVSDAEQSGVCVWELPADAPST